MTGRRRQDPEWREFERLISRIEADAGPSGLVIKSPDRLRCKITRKMREVDVSIRAKIGTAEILITIECRRRSKIQDVTWIEQLASKKYSIGADRTIAVSASGFSDEARVAAFHAGISLRKFSEVNINDINSMLGLDFVMFWHKVCDVAGIGIRAYRAEDGKSPESDSIDYILPHETDLFAPIFHKSEDGSRWSLNDVWWKVQECLDPYANITNGEPPIVRTARIFYPGTVSIDTPRGPLMLGYVFLSIVMWIEPEMVPIAEALRISYSDLNGGSIHRVEFSSKRTKDWRISLQANSSVQNIGDIRINGNWPHRE